MERERANPEQAQASGVSISQVGHLTQLDAVKALAALPRRVVSLLWALTAMRATTGGGAATYRAIAVMVGIADKKNVRAVVRMMESEKLVVVTRVGKLAAVRMTGKAIMITNLLLRVIPYEEVTIK